MGSSERGAGQESEAESERCRQERTFQVCCATARLILVSMLPVMTNTRPGRCEDSTLAAWIVGKVCPEWEMHTTLVRCLFKLMPNLHELPQHTMVQADKAPHQVISTVLNELPHCNGHLQLHAGQCVSQSILHSVDAMSMQPP